MLKVTLLPIHLRGQLVVVFCWAFEQQGIGNESAILIQMAIHYGLRFYQQQIWHWHIVKHYQALVDFFSNGFV